MIEFGIQRESSDGQKDERYVRIHDVGENALLERHLVVADRLVVQTQRDGLAIEALEALAVQLVEEILFAWGDVLDQLLVERLLVCEGFRLAHGALGQFYVASALGDYGAHQGCGVVLHFLFHDVVHLAAEDDGMRGAGVGSGGHGGNVGGFEDEEASRCGAASAGRHIDDDWHSRGNNFFYDVAG